MEEEYTLAFEVLLLVTCTEMWWLLPKPFYYFGFLQVDRIFIFGKIWKNKTYELKIQRCKRQFLS